MDAIFTHFQEPSHPFVLFGKTHLLSIAYLLFSGVLILSIGKRGSLRTQKVLRKTMALVFLFWEIEWQVWHIWNGIWSAEINLPLHLCSIMIWVSMYGLWFEDRRVYGLMYFFGIAGAIQALITPNAVESFPHIRYLSTMFTHSLLVISGLWVVLIEKYRPTLRSGLRCFLGLNVAAFVVYWIDLAVGANYMYVVDKPAVATVMDYFPAWPWYILVLEGILLVLMGLMLLPFIRKENTNAA